MHCTTAAQQLPTDREEKEEKKILCHPRRTNRSRIFLTTFFGWGEWGVPSSPFSPPPSLDNGLSVSSSSHISSSSSSSSFFSSPRSICPENAMSACPPLSLTLSHSLFWTYDKDACLLKSQLLPPSATSYCSKLQR